MTDTAKPKSAERARDLIVQIEERRKELDAVRFRAPKARRTRTGILGAALLVAVGFLAWDLTHPTERPPALDEGEIRASLEFTVFLTVAGIEEYRDRTGALPESLESAGLDDPLLTYMVGVSGYRVKGQAGEHTVEFKEGDDLEPLEASFYALQRGPDGP